MKENEAKDMLKYFFEVGQMRFVKHAGYWLAKIPNPCSIAEHSQRAAIIGFVIASREGHKNPERIAVRLLLHDLHEARLMDHHKVASNYFRIPDEIERKVEKDQCNRLGKEVGDKLYELLGNKEDYTIARDADYLEMAFTAREYFDVGYKDAWDWIERVSQVLKTPTARELCELIKKTDSGDWWKGLKEEVAKMKY